MKKLRNTFYGFVLMYKTSFAVNPILTAVGTAVGVAFVYSIAKIFGV